MKPFLVRLSPLALSASFILSSCATKPENIHATYVSPLTYQDYDCDQLRGEAERISVRASEMSGVQKKKATNDAVAVGVGLVLFWPALFFVKGNGTSEAEIGRLKGEMEAVEKISVEKKCDIAFQRS